MIEIVDEKPDPEVVREVVCQNCGVKLRYVPNDVKERNYLDYSGTPDITQWIDCPKCQKAVTVR